MNRRTVIWLVGVLISVYGGFYRNLNLRTDSNPFDVSGARSAGMNAIWVDRKGAGWMDMLGEPTHIVQSLERLVELCERLVA